MPDPDFRFKLDGKLVEITVSDMTFEEIELLEDAFDAPISRIDLERAKALRLLAFIALRRKDSKVRMEDLSVLPIVSLAEADQPAAAAGEADAGRPTRPASKAKAAKAA